jgi:hypothetical protein
MRKKTRPMTYELAMAAAHDAGDRHAKKHGRKVWNSADYNVAVHKLDDIVTKSNLPA